MLSFTTSTARPVFLRRDDRITAHFLTCFLALIIYKDLTKKVNRAGEKFSPGGRGQPTASESGRCLPDTSSRDREDEGDGRRAERSSAE